MRKTKTKAKKQKTNNSRISFVKMTGTGNDFIILDATKIKLKDRVEFAVRICERHFGVGADGVIFLEPPSTKDVDLTWDFYNADGSQAEMCGNGARCSALFAHENLALPRELVIGTLAGPVKAKVLKSGVEVQMTPPKLFFKSVKVKKSLDEVYEIGFWNTGVPHAVMEIRNWDRNTMLETGGYIRHHEFFKKYGGTNVTFYEIKGESLVLAATFERGVEDLTLACGTGAVAAAAQAKLMGQVSPVTIQMPGGKLKVTLEEDFSSAKLFGGANYIYRGELEPNMMMRVSKL